MNIIQAMAFYMVVMSLPLLFMAAMMHFQFHIF